MQAGFRLVAIVLALALAGGTQACLALCVTPGKPLPAAATAPQKPPCHHCPDKAPAKPTSSEPARPCKHCPAASQDRVASESDHTVLKAAFDLTALPQLELAAPGTVIDRPCEAAPPRVHSPPGDLLHRFCVLLI